MKMRSVLRLFLVSGVVLGFGPQVAAQPDIEVAETPAQISGTDSRTGVVFRSQLVSPERVAIAVIIGAKQIRGDIDYELQRIRIHSYGSNLAVSEILAFQNLLERLPQKISTETRHGDALTSFVNLMASAPVGRALDLDASAKALGGPGFTAMCGQIGEEAVATYRLQSGVQHTPVTVGPICFGPPGLGRCGAGAGPDRPTHIDGLRQRFTQECLNHDQCCYATNDRYVRIFGIKTPVNVCGNSGSECVPEFEAAATGFFFAPDCGRTTGDWLDNFGNTYSLSGGNSSGNARPFTGSTNTGVCGVWSVTGTRTGTSISFTADNPSPADGCGTFFSYTGTYGDCGAASGTWINSFGNGGSWSWNRTSVVGAGSSQNVADRPRSTSRNPARQ